MVEEVVVGHVDAELGGRALRVRLAGHGDRVLFIGQAVIRLVLDGVLGLLLLLEAGLKAAALDHEILVRAGRTHDSMKYRAVIKLVIHVTQKILDGDRRLVGRKLDLDRAHRSFHDDDGVLLVSRSVGTGGQQAG